MTEWKIGVSAFAWTGNLAERHLELLPWLRNAGLRAFEVPMFTPSTLPASEIRKACAASEITCTVCAILPPGINPVSPDAAERSRAVQHLRDCVRAAAEMGAQLIAGPVLAPIGYLPRHRPTDEEWTWAADALAKLVPVLAEHDVTLAIEPVNRAETFLLRTASQAKALCERVGSRHIGVTIDTFHANIEEKNLAVALRSLGPWLKHMHVSESDRGVLGTGHVPVAAMLEALGSIDYQGWFMLEGFGFCVSEPDAPGALWADLHTSPEDIALKGLACLRQF